MWCTLDLLITALFAIGALHLVTKMPFLKRVREMERALRMGIRRGGGPKLWTLYFLWLGAVLVSMVLVPGAYGVVITLTGLMITLVGGQCGLWDKWDVIERIVDKVLAFLREVRGA